MRHTFLRHTYLYSKILKRKGGLKTRETFMETERWQIEALTRDIEQSRAELIEQEENVKYQLQEQEEEIARYAISII